MNTWKSLTLTLKLNLNDGVFEHTVDVTISSLWYFVFNTLHEVCVVKYKMIKGVTVIFEELHYKVFSIEDFRWKLWYSSEL